MARGKLGWFNKWILGMLPAALAALRFNLQSNADARKTQRGICIGIVRAARAIEMVYADDPVFQEEVNKPL